MLEPGTDVTALIWKTLQSSQIQKQLDQSHNMYHHTIINDDKNINENGINPPHNENQNNTYFTNINKNILRDNKKHLSKEKFKFLSRHTNKIIKNIDVIDSANKSIINSDNNNNNHKNKSIYLHKLKRLIYNIKTNTKLKKTLISEFIKNPITPFNYSTKIKQIDIDDLTNLKNFNTNINNLIDLRKNKKWVLYLLSDKIPRYGTIQNHIIFNKVPGWLIDAIQIANKKKLFLIYSTDIRGVNEWLGQFISMINLHHLLSLNEVNKDTNYTALFLHLAGILSINRLNPINRQGMFFSKNVLQKCTFENVKRLLSKAHDSDNLSSFISSTLMCVPQKSGTNAFDLIIG